MESLLGIDSSSDGDGDRGSGRPDGKKQKRSNLTPLASLHVRTQAASLGGLVLNNKLPLVDLGHGEYRRLVGSSFGANPFSGLRAHMCLLSLAVAQ